MPAALLPTAIRILLETLHSLAVAAEHGCGCTAALIGVRDVLHWNAFVYLAKGVVQEHVQLALRWLGDLRGLPRLVSVG